MSIKAVFFCKYGMESNWLQTDFPAVFYFSSVLHSLFIFLIKRSFPWALHCLAVVFISCRLLNLPSCRGFGPWDGPDLHMHVYTYMMVPRALPWHSSLPLREIRVLLCYVKRLGKFTVNITQGIHIINQKKRKPLAFCWKLDLLYIMWIDQRWIYYYIKTAVFYFILFILLNMCTIITQLCYCLLKK